MHVGERLVIHLWELHGAFSQLNSLFQCLENITTEASIEFIEEKEVSTDPSKVSMYHHTLPEGSLPYRTGRYRIM